MQQSRTLEQRHEKTNPEEIITKLKTMIKILEEIKKGEEIKKNDRNE